MADFGQSHFPRLCLSIWGNYLGFGNVAMLPGWELREGTGNLRGLCHVSHIHDNDIQLDDVEYGRPQQGEPLDFRRLRLYFRSLDWMVVSDYAVHVRNSRSSLCHR